MAIIHKGLFRYITGCPLCGKRLKNPFFCTSDFLPNDHPLWLWHDSAMHWKCYARWKHQKEFASLYFDSIMEFSSDNPYWKVLLKNENVHVQAFIQNGDIKEYRITLKATVSQFGIESSNWRELAE